jgi:hypothetical protein
LHYLFCIHFHLKFNSCSLLPQAIWVCILCRKKQELLSKTGQWIQTGTHLDPVMRRIEADLMAADAACDKRPKLERGLSANAADGPLPGRLQRSGSALRRQFSQEAADVLVMRGPSHVQQSGGRRYSAGSDAMLYERQRLMPPTPAGGGRKLPADATKKRGKKTARQHSLSSSEDELRSTPEAPDDAALLGESSFFPPVAVIPLPRTVLYPVSHIYSKEASLFDF